jgi:probable phosphoglycerate mutase
VSDSDNPHDPGPTLYLFRHGATAWSITGQHTGSSDLPLVAQGEQQARALAAQLRGIAFARVFTSPRLRAQRTCELCGLGALASIEPDLAEWDYGAYEGLRTADIHMQRPDWNLFRDGCPGGESPDEICRRADRLIARLRRLRGEVALFSHGHFGRVLGVRWIGLPVAHAQQLLLDTASISILGFEHQDAASPAIVAWNNRSDMTGSVLRPHVTVPTSAG